MLYLIENSKSELVEDRMINTSLVVMNLKWFFTMNTRISSINYTFLPFVILSSSDFWIVKVSSKLFI